ncbi:MAG TPA: 30S ribosomal protein S4 [Phycisphaerales bacterium]|nr:30S ribosomal protein S4 [Phycisphaerales bacterium]
MGRFKVGKMSRRLGIGLTEKGRKILEKRPYPPGQHGQSRRRKESEYSRQLTEKQKLRFLYRLSEKQFKRLFDKAKRQGGPTGENLLVLLEKRLDNVVYRARLAKTRAQARQLVAHGHITVNGRKSKTPAMQIRAGDEVKVRSQSENRPYFTELKASGYMDMEHGLEWLQTEPSELTVKVVQEPTHEDGEQLADVQAIIEFYSR